ncbi:MAG: glycosyltransferase [Moorea sp. SIOASIH]|uniref:Glycosyltransferase 2-like domain-containing protein n=1 Tax=Moorena producens PAL-8-15-08-1 TaxID=1458985 RepID=A0A1D8TQD6_9CYAN|nr:MULTISPECIES: glycosyltransferase [Moorena]AOW99803.1 hypothetical protein BJP34_10375 [Moorena producens PAL-8-15-08-1]NEO34783.1 glycosyltransferase [Moorena sp. SIOASIH]
MSQITETPLVSVLMPVYNGTLYLREAVDSILSQTLTNFEFIIVDDGSTDETPRILDNYNDPRIVRVTNQSNLGIVDSLNRGLKMVRGKYVARMDADDISLPERLRQQVQFLEEHPEIGILGTAITILFDETNRSESTDCYYPSQPGIVRWNLFFNNSQTVAHPTMMVRRIIYEQLKGYDTTFVHAEDYDFLLRACFHTEITNLPNILLHYRRHGRNVSYIHRQAQAKNAILAQRKTLCAFLSQELSFETTHALHVHQWKAINLAETLNVAKLLSQLYRTCISSFRLTQSEREKIQHDVLQGLKKLALTRKVGQKQMLSIKLWWIWLMIYFYKDNGQGNCISIELQNAVTLPKT